MPKNQIQVDPRRTRALNAHLPKPGPVVYWMSRDQRVEDNWALLFAAQEAARRKQPLMVVFALTTTFPSATLRHFDFMLKGLAEVAEKLKKLHIPFQVLTGEVPTVVNHFVQQHDVGHLVTDFSPVKIGREWREKVAEAVKIQMTEVDAHNIVPCWLASSKQEFSAHTFRPKLLKLLPEFLTEFSQLQVSDISHIKDDSEFKAGEVIKTLKSDHQVGKVTWLKPGYESAITTLDHFIDTQLPEYAEKRNDPTQHYQSQLSPYLHFGQVSAQRVVLEVMGKQPSTTFNEAFLDELIVRRELSDNFCFYNPKYDSVLGFPAWAQKSLEQHLSDPRPITYSLRQLEVAETHDDLWNAAQLEMVKKGKMHGYLRMHWAKKILEWSRSPAIALERAIYLNDRYQLDGRDPNGYTGIAWSIGGVHDRPWFERPIFGLVRYMNYSGASKKFSIPHYIEYVKSL